MTFLETVVVATGRRRARSRKACFVDVLIDEDPS